MYIFPIGYSLLPNMFPLKSLGLGAGDEFGGVELRTV